MRIKTEIIFGVLFMLTVSVAISIYHKEQSKAKKVLNQLSPVNYWEKFEGITKERRYIEAAESHYWMPVFTPELNALAGEEITLKGYYLPNLSLDSVLVISRFNNANCFFCGQAGIESVVMVLLKGPRKRTFEIDQRLEVKGILTLNSSDVSKLAFVLEEADVVAY